MASLLLLSLDEAARINANLHLDNFQNGNEGGVMPQNLWNQNQGSLQKLMKSAGLLLALLLAVSASGWSAATPADKAETRQAKRQVTVVSEEEFFKLLGSAPAQEVLSTEEQKTLSTLVQQQFGPSTSRCHVHCKVTSDGVVCTKHGC
jgi:hypothetical protein